MKKTRRKPSQKRKAAVQEALPAEPDRRTALLRLRTWGLGAAALGAVGYVSVGAVQATMAEADLSRIGAGVPAVVQIHEPNCPMCRRLQKETRAALKGFDDGAFVYLVANINTGGGAALAAKHRVGHVTLLLFDAEGQMRRSLHGEAPRADLRVAFAEHLATAN